MITIQKLFKRNKEEISEITMSNGIIELKALTLGATITSLKLISENLNLVTAFHDKKEYLNNDKYYLGATIGPLAGRLKDGKFKIDEKEYQLDLNDNSNHLHGGKAGLHNENMEYFYEDDDRFPSLVFIKEIDHQADGYPCPIKYIVTYKLAGYTLMVNHKAFPQDRTPISMTNHSYFNLSAEDTILDHLLSIDSNEVIKLDETYCPTNEKINIVNTAFDFRVANVIRSRLKKDHPQFEMTKGIDHPYLLTDKHALTLYSPKTKISLNIKTTGDCYVVYMGNFFDEGFVNERGKKATNFSAIALEPCMIPNAINLDYDTTKLYSPSEPFDLTTHYTLSKSK